MTTNSTRTPIRPSGEEWQELVNMLCFMCHKMGTCEVIEGMIEMKNGGAWPAGGWVTDPGAGVTCLSYEPRPVRQLNERELTDALTSAVPMCNGCAARKGSDASQSLHTQRDFNASVNRGGLFTCHEEGNQGKPCGGWCHAVKRKRASLITTSASEAHP